MKYIVLLADGSLDHKQDELGGKTPLMAAETETMDKLAEKAEIGIVKTTPEGFDPGSDVCNLTVLGYNPHECYTGRAPLEAAAMNVKLQENETAFRCNLVTLYPGEHDIFMEDYSAGHISTEEAIPLIESLQEELGDEKVRFYPGISYRHLMVMKDAPAPLKLIPPHDLSGQGVKEHIKLDKLHDPIMELTNSCQMVLNNHPVNRKRAEEGKPQANSPWFWGEGTAPKMKHFKEKFGLNGAMISAVNLLKGIGIYADMEVIDVPGATGHIDTNYEGKVKAALDTLKKNDFVFVHIEGADETGHEGDHKAKVTAIENFDTKVVKPILEGMKATGEDFRILITCDHATPLELKTHTAEPMAYLIWDSRKTLKDNPNARYTEDICERKDVPVYEKPWELMPHFLEKA